MFASRIAPRLLAAVAVGGLAAAPAEAATTKLLQCRYAGPTLSTCSGLMDAKLFPYTSEKICAAKTPAYAIVAEAMGMNKYAVEIRREGSAVPVYRIGRGGYMKANFSFTLDGAFHIVGNDMLLVIRPSGANRVVEVWDRGDCRDVAVDVEDLEKKAAAAGTGE